MERIGLRTPSPPGRRRAHERASRTMAAAQSGAISLQQLAQMPRLQPCASAVLAPRQTPTAGAHRQYRCDHFPPLPSLAVGSKHKPEPNALLLRYDAIYLTEPERSRNRK